MSPLTVASPIVVGLLEVSVIERSTCFVHELQEDRTMREKGMEERDVGLRRADYGRHAVVGEVRLEQGDVRTKEGLTGWIGYEELGN
jgi:hypothetical protein